MKIRIVQKKYHKNGIASAESDDGSGEAVITLTTTMMRYWKHQSTDGRTSRGHCFTNSRISKFQDPVTARSGRRAQSR